LLLIYVFENDIRGAPIDFEKRHTKGRAGRTARIRMSTSRIQRKWQRRYDGIYYLFVFTILTPTLQEKCRRVKGNYMDPRYTPFLIIFKTCADPNASMAKDAFFMTWRRQGR
jgi:hypothetical protein